MKKIIQDWLVDLLRPVIAACVKEGIAEAKAELMPQLDSLNAAVKGVDNTLTTIINSVTSIPGSILSGLGNFNPFRQS